MSREIVDHLNKLLMNELTAIRQYLLHFSILKDNGINRLAEKMRGEFNEEFKHIHKYAERILVLNGIPNFQDTNKIAKYDGKFTKNTVREILESNLSLEEEGVEDIRKVISVAEKERDFVSVMLLEETLKNEEEHIHWFKKQIELIELIGIENYLSTQI